MFYKSFDNYSDNILKPIWDIAEPKFVTFNDN